MHHDRCEEITWMWILSCVKAPEEQQIVSYWKSRLPLNVMNEDFTFNSVAVPSDLRRYMKMWVIIWNLICVLIYYLEFQHCLFYFHFYSLRVEDGKKEKKKLYLPLLLVDELRSRLKDLIVCKKKKNSL